MTILRVPYSYLPGIISPVLNALVPEMNRDASFVYFDGFVGNKRGIDPWQRKPTEASIIMGDPNTYWVEIFIRESL